LGGTVSSIINYFKIGLDNSEFDSARELALAPESFDVAVAYVIVSEDTIHPIISFDIEIDYRESKIAIISIETCGNGLFTKNALIRQDILQYKIKTKRTEFLFTELGNWLLKNNNEFSSEYDGTSSKKNTPMSARLANKRERILARLNEYNLD
jgi:hypothetical protein